MSISRQTLSRPRLIVTLAAALAIAFSLTACKSGASGNNGGGAVTSSIQF